MKMFYLTASCFFVKCIDVFHDSSVIKYKSKPKFFPLSSFTTSFFVIPVVSLKNFLKQSS